MVVVVGQDGPCKRFSVAIRQQFLIFRVMRSRAPHPCGMPVLEHRVLRMVGFLAECPLGVQGSELASCRSNFLKFVAPVQLPRLNLVEKERFIEEKFQYQVH